MTDDSAIFGGEERTEPGCDADEEQRTLRIQRRIHEKIDDYDAYGFSRQQIRALNVFFDLTQEFKGRENFYAVCVTIPKVFFDLDCKLYLLEDEETFALARCTREPADTFLSFDGPGPYEPTLDGPRFLVPVKSNPEFNEMLPFLPPHDIIGCLELTPSDALTEHDRLFLEKYANRIGYQLHNRIIRAKNKEHLNFIQSLVDDIGHNVIVPNMYFRLFYNRLKGKIDGVEELVGEMGGCVEQGAGAETCIQFRSKLQYLHDGLVAQFNEIFKHYEQTSLFLETLLRRRHFEEGRYVLEKRDCNIKKQVIAPQVDRFASRFEEKGIELDLSLGGVPDRDLFVVADVGLLSQVYANLFSNAVKYARPSSLPDGRHGTFVAYGWEVLPNHFEPGVDGVKLNVFTSGPELGQEDRKRLFQSGFRGSNVEKEYGTGHGLFFVRQVVELHGGEVGYEPGHGGNNFYFILPMEPKPVGSREVSPSPEVPEETQEAPACEVDLD